MKKWHDNPPSEAQLRLMCHIISVLPIRLEEVRAALQMKKKAHRFLSKYKPQFDEALLERQEKQSAPLPIDEHSVIKDVVCGRCMDQTAEIRGHAIVDMLRIISKEFNEAGDEVFLIEEHNHAVTVTHAGLYRALIQAIVEAKDNPETWILMCPACQMDLTVEVGVDECPRCGSTMQEIDKENP